MAIHLHQPQIVLYGLEIILGIIFVSFVGGGYQRSEVKYVLIVSTALCLLGVTFTLLYGFASCRPPAGRSIFKMVEIGFQILGILHYMIALGLMYSVSEDTALIIEAVIFLGGLNMGSYIFGSLIALNEFIFLNQDSPVDQGLESAIEREAIERATLEGTSTGGGGADDNKQIE